MMDTNFCTGTPLGGWSIFYETRRKIISKPGITGYWQIFGDRSKGCKNLVECDEFYDKNKSILFDLRILLLTSIVVFKMKHSDSIITSNVNESGLSKLVQPDKSYWLSISNTMLCTIKNSQCFGEPS